jgi:quercetin dioxygenase-like cupin family protein
MEMLFLKATGLLAAAIVAAASGAPAQAPPQRPSGTARVDLQRHDLDIAGWEAIQLRVDFDAGKAFPRHSHPGEEIIYVLKGTLEYRIDGEPPVTLGPGGVLFVPTGAVHAARNVGGDSASELATYIVQKGKALVVLAP